MGNSKFACSFSISNRGVLFAYTILTFIFLLLFNPAFSQNISLTQALAQIEEQYGYTFLYDVALVEDISVTSNSSKDLEQKLESLLAETALQFTISGRNIILKKLEKTTICGTVLDALSGTPLAFANVVVQGTSIGTSTDEAGKFEIEYYPKIQVKLAFSYIGYQNKTLDLGRFLLGVCPKINLKFEENTFGEVIVKAFTLDMMEVDSVSDAILFSPQRIPTLPGWGEPDALRSLQSLPGVSSSDESAANLNIQGGSPDQNLILWDKIPIYHSGHFFGFYSFINPYVVQDINLHRAGFGAEYGGRVSGVIDIEGKPKSVEKPHFGLGLNLINAHAFAEIPLLDNQLQLLFAARRSFTDRVQSQPFNALFDRVFQRGGIAEQIKFADEEEDEDNIFSETNFFYQDYNAKVRWQINEHETMQVSSYFGQDYFVYEFEAYDDFMAADSLTTNNQGISLIYERKWNEQWQTEVALAWSKFSNFYTANENYLFDDFFSLYSQNTNQLRDRSINVLQHYQSNEKQSFQFGLLHQQQDVSFENFFEEPDFIASPFEEYAKTSTTAAFSTYHWQANDSWNVEFGLRAEYYRMPLATYSDIQPRLRIQFHQKESPLKLSASMGNYQQYIYQIIPIDQFTRLESPSPIWIASDDFRRPIRASHFSLNAHYKKDGWLFDISPYLKRMSNLISWRIGDRRAENDFTVDGNAFAYGIDILTKRHWNKQNLWFTYSLSRAVQRFENLNANELFPMAHDQPHKLNISYTLALKQWDISASWVLQSGRPSTEPSDEVPIQSEEFENYYYIEFGEIYNNRLPVYHRLDIAANYKFQHKGLSGKAGLSVFNLYNRHNVLDIDYNIIQFEDDIRLDEPYILQIPRTMLLFTPNLFFQLEW